MDKDHRRRITIEEYRFVFVSISPLILFYKTGNQFTAFTQHTPSFTALFVIHEYIGVTVYINP